MMIITIGVYLYRLVYSICYQSFLLQPKL